MNWESFKLGSKNNLTIISSYQSSYCYHQSKSKKGCFDIVLSQQKLFVCFPGKYSISQNALPPWTAILARVFTFPLGQFSCKYFINSPRWPVFFLGFFYFCQLSCLALCYSSPRASYLGQFLFSSSPYPYILVSICLLCPQGQLS